MALSSAFFTSQLSLSFKVDLPRLGRSASCNNVMISQRLSPPLRSKKNKMFGQPLGRKVEHSFLSGSTSIISKPNFGFRKGSSVSSLPCSQVATGAFTFGTAAVLPFYALMVVAPQAEFTKKIVASSLPYVLLGALYAYLLYLSWTPETIRLIFASKYWLPELPGMAKMFSSEMTLASAWIHLLTIDLFAARQVYGDGLQNNIETRHSVSLCLLSCPIGILAHALTKALTKGRREKKMEVITDEDPISTDFIK